MFSFTPSRSDRTHWANVVGVDGNDDDGSGYCAPDTNNGVNPFRGIHEPSCSNDFCSAKTVFLQRQQQQQQSPSAVSVAPSSKNASTLKCVVGSRSEPHSVPPNHKKYKTLKSKPPRHENSFHQQYFRRRSLSNKKQKSQTLSNLTRNLQKRRNSTFAY